MYGHQQGCRTSALLLQRRRRLADRVEKREESLSPDRHRETPAGIQHERLPQRQPRTQIAGPRLCCPREEKGSRAKRGGLPDHYSEEGLRPVGSVGRPPIGHGCLRANKPAYRAWKSQPKALASGRAVLRYRSSTQPPDHADEAETSGSQPELPRLRDESITAHING